MKKILLAVLLAVSTHCVAQIYIEPLAGYAIDVRNKPSFHLFNTGLSFSFPTQSFYEFSVGFSNSFGMTRKGSDSAFTTNLSLPAGIRAGKSLQPSGWSLFFNNRFQFYKYGNNNALNFIVLIGIAKQKIAVSYDYNKTDYTILNPETSIEELGLYTGYGFEYVKTFNRNRLIAQLNFSTPPIAGRQPEINSFKLMTPLSFNIGYSFQLSKN